MIHDHNIKFMSTIFLAYIVLLLGQELVNSEVVDVCLDIFLHVAQGTNDLGAL